MSNSKSGPFSLASEIEDIPGTEGWEDMYPYYTRRQLGKGFDSMAITESSPYSNR